MLYYELYKKDKFLRKTIPIHSHKFFFCSSYTAQFLTKLPRVFRTCVCIHGINVYDILKHKSIIFKKNIRKVHQICVGFRGASSIWRTYSCSSFSHDHKRICFSSPLFWCTYYSCSLSPLSQIQMPISPLQSHKQQTPLAACSGLYTLPTPGHLAHTCHINIT